MTKINQEEYKILKRSLDEGYSYIGKSRSGRLQFLLNDSIERDMNHEEWSDGWGKNYMSAGKMFQFIKWEDEEPYNIAKLIEEYEVDYLGSWEHAIKFSGEVFGESGETEVKKDIEWLLQRIYDERVQLAQSFAEGEETTDESAFNDGRDRALSSVLKLIDQLDEPDEREQLEIAYKDILNRGEFWFDDKKYKVVPKQELPVIPQWVADNIESKKRVGTRLNVAMSEFPEFRLEKELDIDERECNEIYARAWLDGYEVEKEQKYRVMNKKNYILLYKIQEEVGGTYIPLSYIGDFALDFEFTEKEIKDFDKDYWAFAVPVEEED